MLWIRYIIIINTQTTIPKKTDWISIQSRMVKDPFSEKEATREIILCKR